MVNMDEFTGITGLILNDALAPLADKIQIAFIFGSMAAGTQRADSDLDICVLSDVELLEVVKAVGAVQENLHRDINPVVMSATRYAEQLATHDRFAERIYDEPRIFVIGDDDEFRKLAEDRAT